MNCAYFDERRNERINVQSNACTKEHEPNIVTGWPTAARNSQAHANYRTFNPIHINAFVAWATAHPKGKQKHENRKNKTETMTDDNNRWTSSTIVKCNAVVTGPRQCSMATQNAWDTCSKRLWAVALRLTVFFVFRPAPPQLSNELILNDAFTGHLLFVASRCLLSMFESLRMRFDRRDPSMDHAVSLHPHSFDRSTFFSLHLISFRCRHLHSSTSRSRLSSHFPRPLPRTLFKSIPFCQLPRQKSKQTTKKSSTIH